MSTPQRNRLNHAPAHAGEDYGAPSVPGLVVRGLRKHFGGVQAVRGVSLSVQPGECVALIGPNGAGKSTTFACIAGQHAPTAGEIFWGGVSMAHCSPAQRLHLGVARTFQVAQTFEALTALQNVQLLLQYPAGVSPYRVLDDVQTTPAMALLAQVGLAHLAQQPVLQLPYGAKKRLELALALAGLVDARGAAARAGLLLLDEPAAGLAAPERADLMRLLRSLVHTRSGGAAQPALAVLYTEHNMDAVFGVADRVVVLMDGEITAQGSAQSIAANAQVRARYLGAGFHYADDQGDAHAAY